MRETKESFYRLQERVAMAPRGSFVKCTYIRTPFFFFLMRQVLLKSERMAADGNVSAVTTCLAGMPSGNSAVTPRERTFLSHDPLQEPQLSFKSPH